MEASPHDVPAPNVTSNMGGVEMADDLSIVHPLHSATKFWQGTIEEFCV